MPTREFEIFRVFPCEFVANVFELMPFPVSPEASMIIRQANLYPDDEIHLLPTGVVARPVSDICLRRGEPSGVPIGGTVNARTWVELRSPFRQLQNPVFVPDPSEQFVRVSEELSEVSGQVVGRSAVSDSDVETQFDFPFELIRISPNSV
jgi:hypothetical protein